MDTKRATLIEYLHTHNQLIDEYLTDALKTDREFFESVKHLLKPEERDHRESMIVATGTFLTLIRRSSK